MEELLQSLIIVDEQARVNAWTEFLFNIDQVKLLGCPASVLTKQVLAAGAEWPDTGWNTSSASKRVWSLTGIALVSAQLSDYLHSWLFALALHWDLDVPEISLAPGAAGVAFALSALFTDQKQP